MRWFLPGWRGPAARAVLWLRGEGSCVLRVPSAVVPGESIYLLNPRHPEFRRIRIGEPEYLETDSRLLRV